MPRSPEELPDEHRLCYPDELAGSFKPVTDHEFECVKPSIEAPKTKSSENEIET